MKNRRLAVVSSIFLGIMLLFTIVSRVRNSWLVPNVSSVSPIKSRLNYEVSGMGTIDYDEISFLPVCEGLKVERVLCRTGEWVEEGQDIIKYEKDSVEEAVLRLEIERQECRLAAISMEGDYRELMEDKLKLIERKENVLREIFENDCAQAANITGYIAKMQVRERSVTDGSEVADIAFGTAFISEAVKTEYDSLLNVGDAIEVYTGNDTVMGEVTECSCDNTARKLALMITLPPGKYGYGTEAYFSFGVQSESYDLCIPNTALFQDAKGAYYVLAVEERNSILGNRLVAVRKEVDLLAHDNDYSAVKGEITRNDKVVYIWDREVYGDCPVREYR